MPHMRGHGWSSSKDDADHKDLWGVGTSKYELTPKQPDDDR